VQTHLLLRKYFERKKKTSPGASLRLLAKRLELSPSFLSRILSGKKPVPYEILVKLASLLEIEPEVFAGLKEAHLVSLSSGKFPRKGKAEIETALEEWELTSQKSLALLKQWYYLPILEFTNTTTYDGTPLSISRALRLPLPVVDNAVQTLLDQGLLVRKNGVYTKAKRKLRWGSGKLASEVRNFHDQMMEKAQLELRESISVEDFEGRLITGITFTASPEEIAQAKKKLAEFIHELANQLTQSKGSAVYHLSAQLFPLTKPYSK
jgi:uncharacterized protein (TIGR02147 family)